VIDDYQQQPVQKTKRYYERFLVTRHYR